ncbi:DUF6264 family protein [Microbacterium sp. GXF7504]
MSYAPEIGPDGRPRPKYGEYATPEEQRARIKEPAVSEALSAGVTPAEVAAVPPAPVAPAAGAQSVAAASARRGSVLDRVITIALLAYGLFTVLTTIPAVADYAAFADTLLATMGAEATLSDPGAARGWVLASNLILGVGWVATAALSWLNLRAGRVSFWIPLTAGIVFTMISSVLLIMPLMTDPAVWSAIQSVAVRTP